MPSGDPIRSEIARWLVKEQWGFDERRPAHPDLHLAKAMLVCAKGDGEIADAERAWLLGYCAVQDYSDEDIEEIRQYQGNDDVRDLLDEHEFTQRYEIRMVAIYTATRVCYADGELAPSEIAAIVRMGERLDVAEAAVREVIAAYEAERTAKLNRQKLIFPNGRPY